MIKNESDIIFNRIKTNIGFEKSKKFRDWFHKKYPGMEMHHLFLSYTSIKTTDYCSIPLPYNHVESKAHKDSSNFAIENLHVMLQVMIEYILELEEETKRLRRK